MNNQREPKVTIPGHEAWVMRWEIGYTPVYNALCSCGWGATAPCHVIKRIAVEEMWEHVETFTIPIRRTDTPPDTGLRIVAST